MNINAIIIKGLRYGPASDNEIYRLNEIAALYELRFEKQLNISYEVEFNNRDDLYLLFGNNITPYIETIRGLEKNIFYLSSSHEPEILNRCSFLGVCATVYYRRNDPMLFVKKDSIHRMKNIRIHENYLSNKDYVSIQPSESKGMLEFLFDYLEVVVAERTLNP